MSPGGVKTRIFINSVAMAPDSRRPVGTPSTAPPAPAGGPREPFDDWPVQHVEPIVGYYWYLAPSVLVTQSTVVNGSLDVIDRHNDVVDHMLRSRREEIRDNGGLFLLFDWRSVQSYEQDARARQRERMRAREDGYARHTVVILQPSNKLLRMAVSAANLFTTMLSRSSIEIASSPEPTLRRYSLRPPSDGAPFYGLE